MLQNLRDKIQGWPAIIIFGILSLLLAGWGLGSYVVSHQDTWVAKVGKHEISQQAYQEQMNNLRQQMSAQQGEQFDASYFEKPEVKQQIVDSMVNRYLLKLSGDELGLAVTNASIRQEIASVPAFQVDGKFDPDSYRAVLANNRMTPTMFQEQVRADLEARLLPDILAETSTISSADVDAYLKLQLQTRDLAYVVLPRPALEDTKVSDADVAAYYQAHKSDFVRPEQVSLSYIELDASSLKDDDKVDEAALKARYEQEKHRFVEPEQREVSHILIKVPDNATAEQQKAALAKANKVDKLARAKGSDFAALARKYSDDAGSRLTGGDLGWLQKGMTNKAFEDAMFSMQKGEISKPVLSPEGYHIIWLRDVREGKAKPLDEVREQLATEIRESGRERRYSELAGKLTDIVYQNPTSLEPAAEQLGLKIEHTGLFDRKGGKEGITADPHVVQIAFSDNVLKDGNTSDPISLGSNHMVVIHLDQHKPAETLPLDQVADKVRQKILDQRIEKRAAARADQLFAKLEKAGSLDKLAESDKLDVQSLDAARREQPGVAPAILDKAFTLPTPAADAPRFAKVALGEGSFALLALKGVHPGDPEDIPEAQRRMLAGQMRRAYAASATNEWLDLLKSKLDIQYSRERM